VTDIAIEEINVPQVAGDHDWEPYAMHLAVRNANEAAVLGIAAPYVDPVEVLPYFQDQGRLRKRLFVARLDGEVVGQALFERAQDESDSVGWIYGGVIHAARHRGVGTALFGHVEGEALSTGCDTLQSFVLHGEAAGDTLLARAGVGTVPLADDGVRFMRRRSYELEQVEHWNLLDLPFDRHALTALHEEVLATAGGDYRVHTWAGLSPEMWMESLVDLANGMERDVPRGDLVVSAPGWSAERYRQEEAREADGGRRALTAAVEHVPSGRLVGQTHLSLPSDVSRPVQQTVTVVLNEHRGHRLGLLLKIANLLQLAEELPQATLVVTTNAAENQHMLAINERLGFRPVGYTGAWKKVIVPARTPA
jgi:GNAT superfamily N-acetyltransferase